MMIHPLAAFKSIIEAAVRKNLSGLDLRGINFAGVDLSGANLVQTNLTGANFCGANMTNADLRGAILKDATFSGATIMSDELRAYAKEQGAFFHA